MFVKRWFNNRSRKIGITPDYRMTGDKDGGVKQTLWCGFRGTRAALERVHAADARCCRTQYEAVSRELSYPNLKDWFERNKIAKRRGLNVHEWTWLACWTMLVVLLNVVRTGTMKEATERCAESLTILPNQGRFLYHPCSLDQLHTARPLARFVFDLLINPSSPWLFAAFHSNGT